MTGLLALGALDGKSRQRLRRLGADARALLSAFQSDADADPTELTGAVSVNFLFIERPSSQLGGKVTGYLMRQ